MEGTLALIGSGEYLERCRAVDEHLVGLARARAGDRAVKVACLPTAASTEGEATVRRWSEMGVAWFSGLGCDAVAVEVVDRVSADDETLAARIADADLVYLSGGKPAHLKDTLDGTRAWAAILELIGAGGVLAGCSAGAMVQGRHVAGFTGTSDGFGLWPRVIVFPHFDEFGRRFQTAARRTIGRHKTVIGVDGGTGLVHHAGTFRAVGTGSVHIWSDHGEGVFTDEEVPAELVLG